MTVLFTKQLGLGVSPTLLGNQNVVAKRAQGMEILHMGFGESPFPVPERLARALGANAHHKNYIHTAGLGALREQILDYHAQKAGLDKDRYDCLIAPGSKLFIYAAQMAVAGDLLMPVPSWVSYEPQAKLLHSQAIKFPAILNDEGYRIDPDRLRSVIEKARQDGLNPAKIILNSPNNPTGLKIPEDNLKDIAAICRDEDIVILSDEIYGQVSFDNQYSSIAAYAPERTVISSAVSKHLSLGGWRLGYGLVPKEIPGLFEALCQIASETWSSVAAPLQYALIEAYAGHEDIENHIKACTAIHSHMNSYIGRSLRNLGITCSQPQGAFYCYPDFAPFRDQLAARGIATSEDLFKYLLDEHGLASLPGTAFGEEPERLTLRLSGCDYDGAAALEAYKRNGLLDNDFIERQAPNLPKSIAVFERTVQKIAA